MSEEMKEIRVSASAVRRSLNELAIALACVVLSGLLIFVTSRTSAGAANFRHKLRGGALVRLADCKSGAEP